MFNVFLAALFSRLVPWIAPRDQKHLTNNLTKVLKLEEGSNAFKQFAKKMRFLQILIPLEILSHVSGLRKVTITKLDVFKKLVNEGQTYPNGVIFVTAHLGAWELGGHACAIAHQKPMHVLAKPPKIYLLKLLLNWVRKRLNMLVLWTDQSNLLRPMLTALKKGEALGFVMDQKPEGRIGPAVNFFGIPTEFVSGPATMACKMNCRVISIYCVRTGPRTYDMIGRELLPNQHGQEDVKAVTQLMAKDIEETIRQYPEQWAWNYKRWKWENQKLS